MPDSIELTRALAQFDALQTMEKGSAERAKEALNLANYVHRLNDREFDLYAEHSLSVKYPNKI